MAYDFPASPVNGQEFTPPVGGQTYIYQSPRWLVKGIPPAGGGGGGGIDEAPVDTKQYGRQNAAWTEVVANPTWSTLSGKPATFPPDAHVHAYSSLTGIPATFAPSAHVHAQSDVTGLPAALTAKLDVSAYTAADVLTKLLTVDGAASGLDADLLDGLSSAAFATAGHTHAQSDVTNLTADLAAKLPLAGGTMTGALTLPGAPTANLHAATKQYADAGIPNTNAVIDGAPDWNSITAAGWHPAVLGPSNANHPLAGKYFYCQTLRYNVSYLTQIAWPFCFPADMTIHGAYFRGLHPDNASWTPWKKLADATDLAAKVAKAGDEMTGKLKVSATTANGIAYTGVSDHLEVFASGGAGSPMMTFHRSGVAGFNFGMDTDNKLKVGGFTMGAVAYDVYHAGNPEVPVGAMIWHGGWTAPTGYLKCNGASLSTTTYAALFAVLQYTYGGSGGSFLLPDLRGEFVRGWDDGRGIDAGRVMGTTQGDLVEDHTHTVPGYLTGGSTSGLNRISSGTSLAQVATTSGVSTPAGAAGAETRPRNIALLACIRYQ